MKKLASPVPTGKTFRTFRQFDGDIWRESRRPLAVNARCIAYLDDGHLCNAPAQFLDLQRGGLVCGAHYRTEVLP